MFAGPKAKMAKTGPRKLLALDGGGMRGLISIEVLARIEELVREQTRNPKAVLADYFDYIAGTSTGSIIGTCLALGHTVDEVRNIYLNHGPHMFDRGAIWRRFRSLYPLKVYPYMLCNLLWGLAGRRFARSYAEYPDTPLIETYSRPEVIGGDDVQLGSDHLRTLLMVTMANATTDSPWPVSNNPLAKYNAPDHSSTNASIPLWQLVRASSAAPTIFPPQEIRIGGKSFVFIDGGITSYNNPAFQLFLQATLEPYKLCWPTGEREMLLVSVGTGFNPEEAPGLRGRDMGFYRQAKGTAIGLFNAAMFQQDLLCRAFGKCVAGDLLDREVGALTGIGKRPVAEPLFTYARYNADLTTGGLAALGLSDISVGDVRETDAVTPQAMEQLRAIGRAVAKKVDPDLVRSFPA
jgi:predicted acylesterase/phospholipase RssA